MSSLRADGPTAILRRAAVSSGSPGWTALFLAALLLSGGCGPGEEAPEVPAEDATLEEEAAEEAAPGTEDERAVRPPSLEDIPFRVAGSFPHGEHRRVRCVACHSSPPGHQTHEAVACTECHGRPAEFATLPVRTEAECMACHHDPGRPGGCGQCHGDAPAAALPVPVELDLSVSDRPLIRTLAFQHPVHEALECGTCHAEDLTRGVVRSCSSCHEEHHRSDASCQACHGTIQAQAHTPEVHEGCGVGGCHDDPVATSVPWSRSYCLACHQEQADHEPGRACDHCHLVDMREGPP